MIKQLCVLGLILVFFTGCQVAPTKYDEHNEGQWEAKVRIKDHKKDKSYVVRMNAYAVKDQSLRIEISGPFGSPLATLVMNEDKVQYLLPEQRKYFEGASSPKVLRPILSVPVDPRLFYSVLFDVAPEDQGWSCKNTRDGFLEKCKNAKQGLDVKWENRRGRKKNVSIKHKLATLQLDVTDFKPSLNPELDLFSLRAPKKFKKYRIK